MSGMATKHLDIALSELARARINLEDAIEQDPDIIGPIVHSAYLAIFHAAKAVVLFEDGIAEQDRPTVTLRFIELLPMNGEAESFGKLARYAESLNATQEYDGSVDIDSSEAAELRDNADLFVKYCETWVDGKGGADTPTP